MKNVTKISIAIGSLALFWVIAYTGIHIPKTQTIDSLRVQAEEARIREEQATKARMEHEDSLSKALYLECFNKATTQTGSRFDDQQKEAYDCWRTKTNWTGKLAPASEPPSRSIISNSSQNDSNKSTVRSDNERSSWGRSEVQQAQQAQGKWVATSGKDWPKVLSTQTVAPSWGTDPKGKEANYWMAYETAIKLIRKWEWYAPISKWDAKQCSGWYGHKAPCGSRISKKQADKWLADDTHSWLAQVVKDFPNLTPEAQGALASFRHNCPAGYASVRKNGLKYFNSWCKVSKDNNGKILPEYTKWLTNRRAEEWKFISQ